MRYAWRVAGSVLAMASVATFVAACGGGDDGTDNAGSNSQGGFAAYQSCLAQHGITLPSQGQGRSFPSGSRSPGGMPEGGGAPPSGAPQGDQSGRGGGGFGNFVPEGVDQETWQKAQEACASVRPTGGPGGFGGGGGGGNDSAFAAYRNCLTEHGVSASAGAGQRLNTADAKVAAAEKACAALRPTGRPGGGGGAQPTPAAS